MVRHIKDYYINGAHESHNGFTWHGEYITLSVFQSITQYKGISFFRYSIDDNTWLPPWLWQGHSFTGWLLAFLSTALSTHAVCLLLLVNVPSSLFRICPHQCNSTYKTTKAKQNLIRTSMVIFPFPSVLWWCYLQNIT